MGLASFLGKMVGSGTGELATKVADAVDRFVETPEEKRAAAEFIMKIQREPDKWQAKINKIQAIDRRMFVAGWRPFVGWVCAGSLLWGWILAPIAELILNVCGIKVKVPYIDLSGSTTLIMTLLGMSGLRTYEKIQGISK